MLWLPGSRLPLPGPAGFRLVNAGEGEVGRAWTSPATPYRAEHPSIQWVLAGRGAIAVDGAWQALEAGAITLIPGHRWLRRRGEAGLRLRWVGFTIEPPRADRELGACPGAVVVAPAQRPPLEAGVLAALALVRGEASPAATARALAGLATACALLAEAGGGQVPPPLPPPVARAVDLLDRHYRRNPPLAELARAAGRSPNHLHQAFRAALGCTPAAYAEQLRLRDAQVLLADPALTVAEVARRCGYADPFHFSRVVRRACGASPLALRRRLGAS
jgi:AraC-like DNA-binding protein